MGVAGEGPEINSVCLSVSEYIVARGEDSTIGNAVVVATWPSGNRSTAKRMGSFFSCCYCTSAASAWEEAASEGWSRYTIRREFTSASRFSLEVVRQDAATPALRLKVQLFITPGGRVHAGSLHPTAVEFGETTNLSYDTAQRALVGCRTYKRSIAQAYSYCAYDTSWKALDDLDSLDGVPEELSVVNNDDRVAVFRGGAHVGAYLPEKATRTSDLICRVVDARGRVPDDYSCDRVFELRLEPEVERRAGETPGALELLLAICVEGFWSQGAICHGGIEGDRRPREDV